MSSISINNLQALESASESPRETLISGVKFHRSKNGNKYFRQDKFEQKQIEKYSIPLSIATTCSLTSLPES
jgi:hypothetical protein